MTKIKYITLIFAAALLAAGLWVGLRYLCDNRLPNFRGEYTLYVRPQMSAEQVMDSLIKGAEAKRPGSVRRCFKSEDLTDGVMAPGKYVIKPSYSAVYAVRKVKFGWQDEHKLTLSGSIRSKERIAQIISTQMMADSLCIDSLLRDNDFLAPYGFDSETVFALFLPDTYYMYWTASPESIFGRFMQEYDAFWNEERRAKAKALGLSPLEVTTLASIVNGETLQASEYATIAGVYLNRLRIGMRLQADPTVAFCFDYEPTRILKKHLQVDSPYNTYKYKGLPPAPINLPPKACIDAVLNPAGHRYLYFCASPDFNGTHLFAASFSEHKANARAFQRALTKRQKENS